MVLQVSSTRLAGRGNPGYLHFSRAYKEKVKLLPASFPTSHSDHDSGHMRVTRNKPMNHRVRSHRKNSSSDMNKSLPESYLKSNLGYFHTENKSVWFITYRD